MSSPPDNEHPPNSDSRPRLSPDLSGAELQRWYWLKAELQAAARSFGISTSGSKLDLTERLAHHLDGLEPPPPARRPRTTSGLLPEPLNSDTVLPPGQRSSQQLRAWFADQIGSSFRFDAHMREFIAGSDGHRTLGAAVEHWFATRDEPPLAPAAQFEYNRFSIAWHRDNPEGSAADCRAAWHRHRSLPVDRRPDVEI